MSSPFGKVRELCALLLLLAGCGGGPEGPPLALLITVDTLRADRLAAYGSERDLTPRLDALARKSQVFTSAYAPSAITLPSISALLTGRYPLGLGIVSNENVLAPDVPTLATELSARGWDTRAVVGNFVLRRATGLALGFDAYDDTLPQQERVRKLPERIGRDTTDAALREIDACTGPDRHCFLWVHYQDPHGPYTAPGPMRQQLIDDERRAPDGRRELPVRSDNSGVGGIPAYQYLDGQREVAFYRAGYDAEVAYLDQQVGRLLVGLRNRGLDERALIVFCSDHGEALGERDYWFAHGEYVDDSLVHVPLLIRRPTGSAGVRDDLASLVDVYPTLLGLLAPGRRVAGPGRDLFADGAAAGSSAVFLATLEGASVLRFGLVSGDYKLVISRGEGATEWKHELYRRGHESEDVAHEHPEHAQALLADLVSLQRAQAGAQAGRQRLSAQDREKLRALGYVDP